MAITAQEAQSASFDEARRGFDERQVTEFQQRVVKTLRSYEEEVAGFAKRVELAEQQAAELADAEEAVKRTFLAASRTKREMLDEAEAEAGQVRAEAAADAERMRSEAKAEAERLLEEIEAEVGELRSTAHHEVTQQRDEARAQARAIMDDAIAKAEKAEAHTNAEIARLESRLGQLRTAVADLELRLRSFAEAALEDVVVVKGLVDLETATLDEIEAFSAPSIEGAEEI